MLLFQEFSGETFFNLAQAEFDLGSCPLWEEISYLVLIDFLMLDKTNELVFKPTSHLKSMETYWVVFKNRNVIIELPALKESNIKYILESVKKITLRFPNIVGFKISIKEAFNLTSMKVFENFAEQNSLIIIMNKPPYSIWQAKQISIADFVLCDNQGYFEKKYMNEIYGTRFEKVIVQSDRNLKQIIEYGIKDIIKASNRNPPRMLLNVASSGIKFNNDNDICEIPRKNCHMYTSINAPVFWDTCFAIQEKLKILTSNYNLKGVYLQDMNYDYYWRDPKSIIHRCIFFRRDPHAYTPIEPPHMYDGKEHILQARKFYQKLQCKAISKSGEKKVQEEK